MDCASSNVCNDKHEHTKLPSPSSVWRPAGIIGVFLILQYVRLPLQCETQRLDRGGKESNEDTDYNATLRRKAAKLTHITALEFWAEEVSESSIAKSSMSKAQVAREWNVLMRAPLDSRALTSAEYE